VNDIGLKARLEEILMASPERAAIITAVAQLELRGCLVAAGLVRNTVWDHLHGRGPSPLNDVDIVYFEHSNSKGRAQRAFEALAHQFPGQTFSIKNQAVMHLRNGHDPYESTEDGIAHWPETCTAIGVAFDKTFQVAAPYDLEDLFSLVIRPTDTSIETRELVLRRVNSKKWLQKWPRLKVCLD
jgi:hypothetical protein